MDHTLLFLISQHDILYNPNLFYSQYVTFHTSNLICFPKLFSSNPTNSDNEKKTFLVISLQTYVVKVTVRGDDLIKIFGAFCELGDKVGRPVLLLDINCQ